MQSYCFDIDGTLCTQNGTSYEEAEPIRERIEVVNQLFDTGHTIFLHTARGSGTGIDCRDLTKAQLRRWGVKYHELWFGKPPADVFVDDRAVTADHWFGTALADE